MLETPGFENCPAVECSSKRRKGYRSETKVKRGPTKHKARKRRANERPRVASCEELRRDAWQSLVFSCDESLAGRLGWRWSRMLQRCRDSSDTFELSAVRNEHRHLDNAGSNWPDLSFCWDERVLHPAGARSGASRKAGTRGCSGSSTREEFGLAAVARFRRLHSGRTRAKPRCTLPSLDIRVR